jgi:hypothetical protein
VIVFTYRNKQKMSNQEPSLAHSAQPPIVAPGTKVPYLELIGDFSTAEVQSPATTPEEAIERIQLARDKYEALAPPDINMPDTAPRTLEELLVDRQRQYWMDRGELREGSMKYVEKFVGLDNSPASNAFRLISNMPEEVPNDVFMWAVAKTVLASKVWQEMQGASRFERERQLDLDELMSEDYCNSLISIMQGRARIEIQDGKAVLAPNDYAAVARQLANEIHRRHLSWQERHDIMTRSVKLRTIMPFLKDTISSVRSIGALAELVQFHYGEFYRPAVVSHSEAT